MTKEQRTKMNDSESEIKCHDGKCRLCNGNMGIYVHPLNICPHCNCRIESIAHVFLNSKRKHFDAAMEFFEIAGYDRQHHEEANQQDLKGFLNLMEIALKDKLDSGYGWAVKQLAYGVECQEGW